MIRVLPRRRVRTADDTRVPLAERWSNIVRIYFTPLTKWPRSDRYVAVGWRPDETWTSVGNGEYVKAIEKGKTE